MQILSKIIFSGGLHTKLAYNHTWQCSTYKYICTNIVQNNLLWGITYKNCHGTYKYIYTKIVQNNLLWRLYYKKLPWQFSTYKYIGTNIVQNNLVWRLTYKNCHGNVAHISIFIQILSKIIFSWGLHRKIAMAISVYKYICTNIVQNNFLWRLTYKSCHGTVAHTNIFIKKLSNTMEA